MSEKKERQPNELTIKAMEDAENGIGMSRPFNSVPELMEALNSDDEEDADELTGEAATLAAIREIQEMKKNPSAVKSYTSFDELLKDLLD